VIDKGGTISYAEVLENASDVLDFETMHSEIQRCE